MSGPSHNTVITGSTRGIGFALASHLIEHGHCVTLNYAHDEQQAQAAMAMLPENAAVRLVRADVTSEAHARRLVEQASADRPIDLWINNVGPFLYKPYAATTVDEWRDILDANLTSTFICCQAVLSHMRATGHGVILNVATMNATAKRATPNTLPYAIAKAGIVMLTQTLAKTEAKNGIRINAIGPGFVECGDFPPEDIKQTIPIGRLIRREEVCAAVSFLASNAASAITGAILDIHGGALL